MLTQTFNSIFQDLTIFVTGHTGFKGSWLSIWLKELGAHVVGYSLEPPTTPNNFSLTHLDKQITHLFGDLRDFEALRNALVHYQPDIVFHLAAQPLVLRSFDNPKETFEVNVGGTVNLLEAIRSVPSIKAAVMVTSDKCYANQEWLFGYRENDPLGGKDPYSASKAMAELAITSYRHLFSSDQTAVASVRAGNVIGGGDFSEFRLVPDCMKALLKKETITLRNPKSVRPWLHVLEPLSGYLCLAKKLLEEGSAFAESWNFGPLEQEVVTTQNLVEKAIELWGAGNWKPYDLTEPNKEMGLLRLNWDKAAHRLQWRPCYSWQSALAETVSWFKAFQKYEQKSPNIAMYPLCVEQIQNYIKQADRLGLAWAKQSPMPSVLNSSLV